MPQNDADKFRRLAENRVNKCLKHIHLIGNLSNKSNYSYTDKQVRRIFAVLKESIIEAEKRFIEKKSITFNLE